MLEKGIVFIYQKKPMLEKGMILFHQKKLYSTIQYMDGLTVQYNTVQYNTIQLASILTSILTSIFSGSKQPLRARYCSEILFFRFKKALAGTLLLRNAIFRFKKAPAGTLLLRNAIFQVQKSPCGHVAAQKCYF